MRGPLFATVVFISACGTTEARSPRPETGGPEQVVEPSPADRAARDVAGSHAPPPVSAPGRTIATSVDATVELRETGAGAYAVHDAQGDRAIPGSWTAGSEGRPALSSDGALLGVQRVAPTGKPEFEIHRLDTLTLVAVLSPATSVAGGKIEATFGAAPGSVVWTFSRADCELQDVASGKPKCGSCDNSDYAAFNPSGKPVARTRSFTTNCVK